MIFTIQFYRGHDRDIPWRTVEEPTLYDAMVVARKGTQGASASRLADIFDAHGQFIVYFRNGEIHSESIRRRYNQDSD